MHASAVPKTISDYTAVHIPLQIIQIAAAVVLLYYAYIGIPGVPGMILGTWQAAGDFSAGNLGRRHFFAKAACENTHRVQNSVVHNLSPDGGRKKQQEKSIISYL